MRSIALIFLALSVEALAVDTAYAPPLGGLTFVVPSGQSSSISLPLIHGTAGSGALIARIGSIGTNYLDVPTANWTAGGLSNAATPYYVKIRSGAQAGRIFMVSTTTNTTSRVYLTTDGADLSQAGFTTGASGDVFELVLADTLLSLFGNSTLAGGPSDTDADLVQVWGGAAWLVFYYNTSRNRWERNLDTTVTPSRDTFVLRPDRGIMITRKAAGELRFYVSGRVPEFAPKYYHARPGTTFLSAGAPSDVTLASLALHTQPGWQAAPSTTEVNTSADYIQVWAGAIWFTFFFDSTLGYWRRDLDIATSGSRNTYTIPAGRPFMLRRLGVGETIVSLPLPYSLP